MSLVVVGGHTRNIGKTSVVAGLIAALPRVQLDGHQDHPARPRNLFGARASLAIARSSTTTRTQSREESTPGDSDSARFLAAGARRSFWLRTRGWEAGQCGNGDSRNHGYEREHDHRIKQHPAILWKPDLYLVVVDFESADFKESALRYLDRADCLIPVREAPEPRWSGVSRRLVGIEAAFPGRSAALRQSRSWRSSLTRACAGQACYNFESLCVDSSLALLL